MEIEQKSEAYKCTMCIKKFKFQTRYEKHLETDHNLSCDQCDIHFKTFHQKKRHDRSNHPTNFSKHMKEKKCRVCPDLSFKTEEEYLLHVRDIHKGKFIDCYMCNVCGKTFKTRSELNQHINSKCGTEKQFICKVCGQKLMSPGSLYNHMRRHNDKASFMCRYCAKLFLTAGQLKVHERIHTQQKDFVCNVCNKGFCHRQSLITHSSVHTGIKPYQCEGCGKSFSCVGNLFKHRKTHSDTCGLIPLTTHRVQNPATKIKVRINTPASSKLKLLRKNKEIQEKFAMLDSTTDRGTLEESGSSKNEEINYGARSNIEINDSIDEEKSNIDKRNEFDNNGIKIYLNKDLLDINEEINIKEENMKPSIKQEIIIDNSAEGNDDFKDDSDDSTYKPKSKKATTKIKVRIKTPSKLKLLKKNKSTQEKFAMVDSATDRDILEESGSSKEEEIHQGARSNIKTNNMKRSHSIDEESNINKQNEFDDCGIKIHSNDELLDDKEDIENKDEVTQEIIDNSTDGNYDFSNDSDDSTYKPKSKKACQRNKDPLFDLEVNNFIKERKLENAKRAACKYCNKEYNQFRWLYRHEQDHQKNDILEKGELKSLPFKCSCCKKSFETKEDVKQHQQLTHSDILSCHDCGDKIFANIDSLRTHRHIFHNGVPRKEYIYICEKCGKKFKQKSLLQVHNETNCGVRPLFQCGICQKELSSDHTRKAHMRIHTSEKHLICKFCSKTFHWKGQLKVHERSHTGEKPYTCLFCPRAFAYRDSLITHSTLHTGVKPYFCKGCGWRFSCIGNLVKHKVTHASTCGAWYQKNMKEDCDR